MSWPLVPLSDAALIQMGTAPPGSSYNEASEGVPMIAGAGDYGEKYPLPKKWTTQPTRMTNEGDLIVCVRATIGDLNWADKKYCLGRGVAGVRAKRNVADLGYLAHVIASKKRELTKLGTGSTFLAIRRDDLKGLQIPLPPLKEQKRIAAILDKADAIRRKRQQAIELADQFLRSVFLDMFGDPVTNPKEWRTVSLGSLTTDWRGGTSIKPKEFTDRGFPVIHKGAIRRRGKIMFDIKKKLFTTINCASMKRNSQVDSSFMVVTLRDLVPTGPSIGLIASVADADQPQYLLAQGAYGFRITDELQPAYLVALSNNESFRHQIRRIAVGSTQIHIRGPLFRELSIPVPPVELLKEYEEITRRVSAQVTNHTKSLKLLGDCSQSFSASAFEGN